MKLSNNWIDLTNDLFRQVGSKVKAWPLTSGRVIFTGPDWAIITSAEEFGLADEWLEYEGDGDRLVDDDMVMCCILRATHGIAAPNSNGGRN